MNYTFSLGITRNLLFFISLFPLQVIGMQKSSFFLNKTAFGFFDMYLRNGRDFAKYPIYVPTKIKQAKDIEEFVEEITHLENIIQQKDKVDLEDVIQGKNIEEFKEQESSACFTQMLTRQVTPTQGSKVNFSQKLKKILSERNRPIDLNVFQKLIEKEDVNIVAVDENQKTAFYYIESKKYMDYFIFSDVCLGILKKYKTNKQLINDVLRTLGIKDIIKLKKEVGFDKGIIEKELIRRHFEVYMRDRFPSEKTYIVNEFFDLGIDASDVDGHGNHIVEYCVMNQKTHKMFIYFFDFFKDFFNNEEVRKRFLKAAVKRPAYQVLWHVLQNKIVFNQPDVQEAFESILKKYYSPEKVGFLIAKKLIEQGANPIKTDQNNKGPFYYCDQGHFEDEFAAGMNDLFVPYVSNVFIRKDVLLCSLEIIVQGHNEFNSMFKALDSIMNFTIKDFDGLDNKEQKSLVHKSLARLFNSCFEFDLSIVKKLITFGADPCRFYGTFTPLMKCIFPPKNGITFFSLFRNGELILNWEFIKFFNTYKYNGQAVNDLLSIEKEYIKEVLQYLCKMYDIEYDKDISPSNLLEGLQNIKLMICVFHILKKQCKLIAVPKPIRDIILSYVLINSVKNFKK